MPNIRRTFPGDDKGRKKDDDDEDDQPVVAYRGKQLRVGGKHLGSMRPQSEEEDEDSDEESNEEEAHNYARGGKQLRPSAGGGKYLRPSQDDEEDESDEDDEELEDDDEEEDEEQPSTQRAVYRGGGKNLLRMRQQEEPVEDSEDDSDEQEEDDDEEEEEEVESRQVVMPRGGGKSLSRMRPPKDSDEEDADESAAAAKGQVVGSAARGKQLRRPEPEDQQPAPKTTISHSPGRGKQLRRPEPEEDDQQAKTTISRSPAGGKQLRRSEPEDDDEPATTSITRPTAPRGKQLRPPEPEEEKAPAKPKAAPSRGKQLRRPPPKDDDEHDESEEDEDEDDDDDDEDFEEEVAKRKPPKKKAPARAKRPTRKASSRKKVIQEESEEEELFGDDDVSSDDEELELDINNTEALIKDEEDRKRLDALPELEREAILGERFEKLKAEQDMKKAIREAKRKESEKSAMESKKRKASASKKPASKKAKSSTDDDEELARKLAGRRQSVRDRDATKAKSKKAEALAVLKKEKKIQQQRVEESSSESSQDFGDDDDDSDDDYEEGGALPWQKTARAAASGLSRLDKEDESGEDMDIDNDEATDKKDRAPPEKSRTPEVEADLVDFRKVTLSRHRLGKYCHEPYFDDLVVNSFVRVLIGEDDSGVKVYRLCQVVGVEIADRVVKLPVVRKNEKPVATNKRLRLKFGNSEKVFPMSLISDTPPTESDVRKYVASQKDNRLKVLSKRRAIKIRRQRDELVNTYTYTTEDIERNLKERQKQGKSLANLGLEQTKRAIAVQAAKDSVYEAERLLKDAQKQLLESAGESFELNENVEKRKKTLDEAKEALAAREEEERTLRDTVEERKRRLANRKKDKNWAKVNERALQANQRADREANKKEGSSLTASGKKEEFNPYARRKVKPKILWEVGQQDEDKEGGSAQGEEKKDSREAPVVENSSHDAPRLVHEPNEKADALTERHQFAIDEEGLASGTAGLGLGSKRGPTRKQRVRKGISLADYLERKANGTL